MGALLGAVLGVGLALMVENAETPKAVAAPELAAVLTDSSSSSQPPAPRTTSAPDPRNGNVASGSQGVQAADQREDEANQKSEGRRDKPGKDKGKAGSGKGKDK
jgi:hypothetical protein